MMVDSYEATMTHLEKGLRYAEDTQLYISTFGDPSDDVAVLLWCQEAVWYWMGDNRLQLNPGKAKWLWVHEASRSRNLNQLSYGWNCLELF